MKILLYMGKDLLGGHGGTEKVMCNFANELNTRGHDVILMTNSNSNGELPMALGSRIKLVNIGGTKFTGIRKYIDKILCSTSITRWLFKTFPKLDQLWVTSTRVKDCIMQERPEILIAALPSDLLEMGYRQRYYPFPIILMMHNEPNSLLHNKSKRIFRETLKSIQKHVDLIQVLMPEYITTASQYYDGKIIQIYNAVPQLPQNSVVSYSNDQEQLRIIYAARLIPTKQQDVLIKAFAGLQTAHPKWVLHLWGIGDPEYTKYLQELIADLQLQNKILLQGYTNNIMAEILEADICAFPSSTEGFSLALTEAMSAGLPCIGCQSAQSVNSIINDGVNGLLYKNGIQGLQDKLEMLMDDPNLRKRLGTVAKQQLERFAPQKIWQQWEDVIVETVKDFAQQKY